MIAIIISEGLNYRQKNWYDKYMDAIKSGESLLYDLNDLRTYMMSESLIGWWHSYNTLDPSKYKFSIESIVGGAMSVNIKDLYRRIGKSTVLNALMFDLQLCGYCPLVVTSHSSQTEYFACGFIDIKNAQKEITGRRDTLVVVVDEYDSKDDSFVQLQAFCECRNISVIGFVF